MYCLVKLFVYIIFFQVHYGQTEDIKDLNISELLHLYGDTQQIKFDVNYNDVNFFLITRSQQKDEIMSSTVIDKTKATKFIIHGWIENHRRTWYSVITEEFLKQGDYNIIQVNWEKPARSSYISSAMNTRKVGELVSKFIIEQDIPVENIHLIGHSLGAHIAGFAAKSVKTKNKKRIHRISGLDPAGPYFRQSQFFPSTRLAKDDAEIVDAIHTDSGNFFTIMFLPLIHQNKNMYYIDIYGINFPLGTFDIIVNNGRAPQPGCLDTSDVTTFSQFLQHSFCSHTRSVKYFIEWINRGKFECNLCKKITNLFINKCIRTMLSEQDVNENIRGICFTETNKKEPYLLT